MELNLDELRATYDHPADKSVIEVIDQLERLRVENSTLADLAKARHEWNKKKRTELTDRLEQAEQAVARVREVIKTEAFEVREYVTYKAVPVEYIEEALDGEPNV